MTTNQPNTFGVHTSYITIHVVHLLLLKWDRDFLPLFSANIVVFRTNKLIALMAGCYYRKRSLLWWLCWCWKAIEIYRVAILILKHQMWIDRIVFTCSPSASYFRNHNQYINDYEPPSFQSNWFLGTTTPFFFSRIFRRFSY